MKTLHSSVALPVMPESKVAAHYELALATPEERETIYHLRHEVYACEIGQHAVNEHQTLKDKLDVSNVYVVARCDDGIAGFISLTPPTCSSYSIDKYFTREQLPFRVDAGLFEVRLLTVRREHRGTRLALLLMYAAFRWVESHGGTHITAIGRREIMPAYLKTGLQDCGLRVQCGGVVFHLLHETLTPMRQRLEANAALLHAMEKQVRWSLGMPMHKPAACFHGGAFFDAIGPRFDRLDTIPQVINADVLDAWFPPAPAVLESLQDHLPWLLRTSPPTGCEGLVAAIAEARGVGAAHVLVGAGSSDLIFLALTRWLKRESRVLLLDPTYGEYAHLLEKVIGCRVDRLTLRRERGYEVPLAALEAALTVPYDLVVLVNPNSPTGRHVAAADLRRVLVHAQPNTRVWIDETYIDFLDSAQSMEKWAASTENVIVCKSMSKAYALSGARVAYLCAGPHQLEELRAFTPPWAVSLVAQLAGVRALESPGYYRERWQQTAALRADLAQELEQLGWEVIPGLANFLLCHLPVDGLTAAEVVSRSREHGLFLRDAVRMGAQLGDYAVRVAVKDAKTNRRAVAILRSVVAISPPHFLDTPGGASGP